MGIELDDSLMTVKEVTDRLKFSESFVRKLLSRGQLQRIKIGSAVRISRADFEKFLRDRTVCGKAKTQQQAPQGRA
jgi:excisionase family DNA binding protein